MFYTYILQSIKDKKWYTGATDDLRKRFKLHNDSKVPATKGRGPFELIYYEACKNKGDAFAREKYLKSGPGKSYLCNRLKRFLTLTGLLILFLLISFHSAEAGTIIRSPAYLGLSRGLVGCWNFDGSYTKVPDCSENNNTGTITGAVKKAGKVGQALDFDGDNDSVTLPSSLSQTSQFTFSVWVNVEDVDDDDRNIIKIHSDEFIIKLTTAQISYYNGSVFDLGITLPLNSWQHVIYTYDGTTMSAFLNGVGGGTPQVLSVDTGAGSTVTIGTFSGVDDFRGLMDEMRLYNRALSANEISRLYRIGLGSVANRSQDNIVPNGLVGYWSFDGADIGTSGTIAKDRSGNNNNGTITGTTQIEGKVGQALDFDGAGNFIYFGDPDIVDGASSTSISLWVKSDIIDSSGTDIIEQQNGPGANAFTMEWPTSDDLRFRVNTGAGLTSSTLYNLKDTDWHHIAGVYDGSNIYLYIDGVAQGSPVALSGTIVTTTDSFEIGVDWDGKIDEVRIYNRALSAGEVSRLYQSTQGRFNSSKTDVLTSGLVGHWTFDGPDISGTRAKDVSGNENHGTITGAVEIEGKVGQALSFDGVNDEVNLGNVASFDFSATDSQFTLSAWVKPDDFGQYSSIIGKYLPSGEQRGWLLGVTDSTGQLDLTLSDEGTFGTIIDALATLGISAGQWSHVLSTIDVGTDEYKLYVNGQEVEATFPSGTTITDIYPNTSDVIIGNPSSDEWDGLIDEVRLYDRALSAGEVTKLYNMGR